LAERQTDLEVKHELKYPNRPRVWIEGPSGVILAAVLLIPVALGAGEKDVVSPLTDEHWSVGHPLNFKTPSGFRATSKPGAIERMTDAPSAVWKKNKAARKLLTSPVESLKWP
jgi:hypothetical protein